MLSNCTFAVPFTVTLGLVCLWFYILYISIYVFLYNLQESQDAFNLNRKLNCIIYLLLLLLFFTVLEYSEG